MLIIIILKSVIYVYVMSLFNDRDSVRVISPQLLFEFSSNVFLFISKPTTEDLVVTPGRLGRALSGHNHGAGGEWNLGDASDKASRGRSRSSDTGRRRCGSDVLGRNDGAEDSRSDDLRNNGSDGGGLWDKRSGGGGLGACAGGI